MSVKPQPTIKWFKDKVPIKTSNRITVDYDGRFSTLTIRKPTPQDQGTYVCVAKNELGEASTTTTVVIKEKIVKPEVIGEFKQAEGVQGGDARFDLQLGGHPKPTVEWFRNNVKITDGGKFKIIEKDGIFTLIISGLIPSDSGIYKCVASNEAGKRTLQSKLVVKEPEIAIKFEEMTVPITAKLDQEVTLTSTMKAEAPQPAVTVTSKDTITTKTKKMEEVEFKVVPQPKAEPAKPKPTITEKVEVTTTKTQPKIMEKVEFKVATLPKEEPPKPKPTVTEEIEVKTLETVETKPKGRMEEVEFKVAPLPKAEAPKPKPIVTEKIEVITIKSEPKLKEAVEFKVAPLPKEEAPKPKPSLTEVTTVKTERKEEVEFKVAPAKPAEKVVVPKPEAVPPQPKPVIKKPKMAPIFEEEEKESESIVAEKGQDVTLTTTIKSEPKPQITWLKNDDQLRQIRNIQLKEVDSKYTVVIKAATPEDSGTYTCKATNELGTSFKTFEVNIEGNANNVHFINLLQQVEGKSEYALIRCQTNCIPVLLKEDTF